MGLRLNKAIFEYFNHAFLLYLFPSCVARTETTSSFSRLSEHLSWECYSWERCSSERSSWERALSEHCSWERCQSVH